MPTSIVVGFDGSRTAWSALDWAAADAGRRRLPLRIVHVREPWCAEHPLDATTQDDTLTARCERLLAEAAQRARDSAPEASVSTALVTGAVTERLRTESETADTVVVGSRGLGGFAGLVLGSVGLGLAGCAGCPVVVVRRLPRAPSGEIVVGYDGSPAADQALEYAAEQAAARRGRLHVLHGLRRPPAAPHPAGFGPVPMDDGDGIEQRLAEWHARSPGAELTVTMSFDHPIAALAAASRTADLVVVGAVGLSGVSCTRLGSVGHSVLHRAHCPVAVVSAPTTPA
ncbi:universal stress protein [Nonomuraea gerenzanensis]|uniref:Universal stress protein family n=1 Tax=Nonomuraea gerenzanensis TaxID=93944 RepID=A0A1M4EBA1_9ACTN|nr:universal stress protein [Nonomuraea gerenzanensis]UBU18255.1 universal stress protein [Nonomuraea gerenzanensis]SBO96070.1 Universal stress protein family [Nonomuraea gerenzanensis]